MKEHKITTVEDLIHAFNDFPNKYIYRGHADADWKLESSLERVIGAKWCSTEARRFEDYSLDQFKAKFHLYDRENINPDSKLAWLAIMQHYGVPTRLLDFTDSPYVALYFALEAYQPLQKRDISVFALDYSALMDASIKQISDKDHDFNETRATVYPKQDAVFDETVDRFSYDIAWVTEPKRHNQRLDRQGGCFLVAGNRDSRISEVIELPIYGTTDLTKFRIDHGLYAQIFALLRKMNLTSKGLYGDLDGLARAIRMQMQVYSV